MKSSVNIEEQIDARSVVIKELTPIQKAIMEKDITGRDTCIGYDSGKTVALAYQLCQTLKIKIIIINSLNYLLY